MMVRMSLPLAVLRSKLRPICARTLTLQLWRSSSVWTRSWVLRPQRDSSVDEDGLYLSRLRESHHLLAFNAIVLGARGGLASAPGKCAEITFLALAGLVVGADPAVDGDLSQLNLLGNRAVQVLANTRLCTA